MCGLLDKDPVRHPKKGCLLFPASGYRNNNSGTTLNNVTTNGYCWSGSANSGNNGHNLNLNSDAMYWNNNNRANGFPVRPVVEIAALCLSASALNRLCVFFLLLFFLAFLF